MADYNAGSLYYTVDAKLGPLLKAEQAATQSTQRLGDELGKTTGRASAMTPQMTKTASAVQNLGDVGNRATTSIKGLVAALGGLVALQGVGGVIAMADEYNAMSERVKMATRSQEEFEIVQERLLATANGTYRALSEAQEVFIGTSDNLRDLGYTLGQALDITDSLSYSFVRNATATDRAQSAMRAYDLALNKGKVDAIAWQTINAAIPTIVQDIANATGKASQEIRQMGAAGELTAQMLNEGLLTSLNDNKKAADEMATTVADAFTNLRTNLSVFIGEANKASGATRLLSAAIGGIGDNIEVIVKGFSVLAAGAMARYIAVNAAAAKAAIQTAWQSRQSAIAALDEAKARNVAAQSALAAAQANAALGTNLAALTAAQKTAEASTRGLAAAQVAAGNAGKGMLALLGGPAGIIALLASAGTAFWLFSDGADKARESLKEIDKPLEDVLEKFRQMNEGQREAYIIKQLEAQEQAAKDSRDSFNQLYASISSVNSFRTDWSMRQWSDFRDEIMNARRAGEDLTPIIKRAAEESGVSPDVINTWLKLNGELLDTDKVANDAATRVGILKNEQHNLANSARDAAAGQRELNIALNDKSTDDYLARLREQKASIEDNGSALKQTERYIKSVGELSAERTKELLDEARAVDAAREAQKRANTSSRAATKTISEEARAREQNTKTIEDMARELTYAALAGEQLAIVKAQDKLNQFATPEELQRVKELASELFKIEELKKLQQKVGDDPTKYIRGDVDPLSGGAFDDQTARYDAEAVKEQERYEAQLTRLREAMEAQKLTQEEYQQIFEESKKKHEERMGQIGDARQAAMLKTYSDMFGGIADIMKASQGEQSGIYRAMFAVSKAFAVASATINAYDAISKAWNTAPFPANLPAVAATAPQVLGVVSAIQGTSFGGGRFYGGAVDGNKVYRVNEGGAPEIFNAADGHQYMMPNKKGEVISNRDATAGGGSPKVTVILNEDASKAGQVNTDYNNEETVISICVSNVMGDGALGDAIGQKFGVRGQGQ